MAMDDPFDLILLDRQMPLLDGLGTARGIRALPDGNDMLMVIMSSLSNEVSTQELEQFGITASLTKPVRQAQLHECLGSLLRGTGQQLSLRDTQTSEAAKVANVLGRKVLLVEDNPVNQEVARGMLDQLSCITTLAHNGREAIELLQNAAHEFDVVLMDCQMPEMDGYTATRKLRELERSSGRSRLPVIALTANAMKGDRERCLEAGMDEYLSKPFGLSQLREAINRHALGTVAGALDTTALDALRAIPSSTSTGMLERLIPLYLDSTKPLIERLTTAAGKDCDTLRQAAHALKSSSFNVGGLRLAALCTALENAARNNDLAAASNHVPQVLAEYVRVTDALRLEAGKSTGDAA
jgi:CheY-like chemotaxis protein